MGYYLCETRNGQETDQIQRFEPRFWTVDFPRPMMASVSATAPDALRVEVECHHRNALAGLIWASEDTLDHPLLAYDTDRDYGRTTLSFRWRSSGIIPLDQPHGPTLTIEGIDAAGQPRSWYVRLWNYAVGTPTDAQIILPFGDLAGGYNIETAPDPVHPRAIDRMFISLPPTGYDPASADLLPERVNGWAELSEIACAGERSMLEIGDVMLPPHGIGMCTAYDDAYNQTPQRLLRQMRGLGYSGEAVHYVGMSHFYRLYRSGSKLEVARDGDFAAPARSWHRAFFADAFRQGISPVVSLSFELFDADCPDDWKQRAPDGSIALSGWVPPSAVLSPVNGNVRIFLRNMLAKFVTLLSDAECPLKAQIGEPWWWVTGDAQICLYDDFAKSRYGSEPPVIADLRAPLNAGQIALLDWAGRQLFSATKSIADFVQAAFPGGCEMRLLVFTPTILDPDMPELYRANLPTEWAWPRFDRLQLEDYDWLTAGADARRRAAYSFVQSRLNYPPERQDYLAGFVLSAGDADAYWRRIDAGLEEAATRGIERRFVWALPQVNRDGYTRLASPENTELGDTDMQAFDDILYPLALGRDAAVAPEFSTNVMVTASGHERRSTLWSDARLHFDVGPGIRSEAELGVLIEFFRARRGAARGFRIGDPFDFSSNAMTGTPRMTDQLLGIGDGLRADYALRKSYGPPDDPQLRPITRPRAGSIMVSVSGEAVSGWTLEPDGTVRLAVAPATGAEVRAGFLFDVPVRFAEDRIDISGAGFAAGEAPSVPLVEIREAP